MCSWVDGVESKAGMSSEVGCWSEVVPRLERLGAWKACFDFQGMAILASLVTAPSVEKPEAMLFSA